MRTRHTEQQPLQRASYRPRGHEANGNPADHHRHPVADDETRDVDGSSAECESYAECVIALRNRLNVELSDDQLTEWTSPPRIPYCARWRGNSDKSLRVYSDPSPSMRDSPTDSRDPS